MVIFPGSSEDKEQEQFVYSVTACPESNKQAVTEV